jgi:uncharacterized membrane protein
MFGRQLGVKKGIAETAGTMRGAVGSAADAVVAYVDPLVKDEKLRQRVGAAIIAAAAVRQRIRRQAGLAGLTRRLSTDPVLRAQLLELGTALQAAQKRAKKTRSHRVRDTIVLFLGGLGTIIAALPATRRMVTSRLRGRSSGWGPGATPAARKQTTAVEEEIEVAVPVPTAYNQWTQFEDFPRFMDGVDEVRQLDNTLLHWAATIAGKHAEWDAKIVEQEPDRRITWESTDGRYTRGTVSFEEAGTGRSRIRLQMTYTPDGVAEKVGSAAGLDKRRIRGDLERFRELIESQQFESGAWRGEIEGGAEATFESAN